MDRTTFTFTKKLYSSKSKSSIIIQRKYSFVKSTIFIQKNIHFLKIQNIHSKKYSFEKKAVLARAMLGAEVCYLRESKRIPADFVSYRERENHFSAVKQGF